MKAKMTYSPLNWLLRSGGNFFLKNFNRTDRIFRAFQHLPQGLRYYLIEEYVRFAKSRALDSPIPERMTIFLTNQCNMKCAHCFIVKEHQPQLAEMTLEEYRKMFASLRGNVSQALFTGGEPTLRKDFADIVVAASREGGIDTASVFSNALNGEHLTSLFEDILGRCTINLNFQTSIDGTEAFHDANRRVPGALAHVRDSIERVQALQRRHPGRFGRIVATTVVSRHNLDILEDICDLVLETEVVPAFAFVRTADDVSNLADRGLLSDFAPEEFKSDGSPKFQDKDYLSVSDMDKALEIIDRRVWRKDSGRLIYNYNRTTLEAIRDIGATGESPLSDECRMGYDDLIVLPDGLVSRCEMLSAPVNLKDFDFDMARLLTSTQWQSYLGATAGCWCTHDCGIGVSMMKEPKLLKKLQYTGVSRTPGRNVSEGSAAGTLKA
jgi:MoaA/NifB/PqqE/SkfB family radical SAM enzyme